MSDDLSDLYQEIVLDHGKRPRNFGDLPEANRSAEGFNPLCGDRCRVQLDVEDDRIVEIRFAGEGCAISTASASLMTEALKGLRLAEARDLFERLHDLVTQDDEALARDPRLGKLAVFAGVRRFPLRVKCATLAWHTLNAAIEGKDDTVTTE
jgi:nitrogen fixation NifU-like protein